MITEYVHWDAEALRWAASVARSGRRLADLYNRVTGQNRNSKGCQNAARLRGIPLRLAGHGGDGTAVELPAWLAGYDRKALATAMRGGYRPLEDGSHDWDWTVVSGRYKAITGQYRGPVELARIAVIFGLESSLEAIPERVAERAETPAPCGLVGEDRERYLAIRQAPDHDPTREEELAIRAAIDRQLARKLAPCACGCGLMIHVRDDNGVPRRYAPNHSQRDRAYHRSV